MRAGHEHRHERRYGGGADRLRSPDRVRLLEVPRVVAVSAEGLTVSSVLDVGTGTGLFAEAFAGLGARVTGVDPNTELLARARELVPGAQFREGIAESLPYPDSSFDLVFYGLVLHETDDTLRALSEARRVSRLRVAVVEWPYREEEHGPPLAHRLEPERVIELARSAGFGTVERLTLSHVELFRMSS
jgi:ubiquinone/menaquinone biosynthesis C-methylase UbiE